MKKGPPAPKYDPDELLFREQPKEVKRLARLAKSERRQQKRLEWRRENLP